MAMYECTDEQFLDDVKTHRMEIIQDNGLFRHIRFERPDDRYHMHFTLTTWPCHLCVTGDMGTFVFHQIDDMFNFFQLKRLAERPKETVFKKTAYWAEKCICEDRYIHLQQFDRDRLRKAVKDAFDAHFEAPESEAANHCWKKLEWEVLDAENGWGANQKALDFDQDGFKLTDFGENNLESFTYQFIWSLYAIAWGIEQYDATKSPAQATA